MAENSVNSSQVNVWDTQLPDDLPVEIKCPFCGEPKQLLRLNNYIAFWVHTDLHLFRKCKILTFRTSFIKNVMKTFKDIQDRNKLLVGGEKHDSENSGSP